eukprot:CAMPEP_0119012144 /NCGR_PEP_ID=MMETSP1176-20130426/6108_1 /TAXON_ID=265551 /ORGANISM="Synedropsis recta cf, Strain CCMP1620" /LENGTH=698 /DNA_ID=CAMNT_0006965057 /DNA_START=30 /DNA_END=2123 /DNA_ORIENTATION=-
MRAVASQMRAKAVLVAYTKSIRQSSSSSSCRYSKSQTLSVVASQRQHWLSASASQHVPPVLRIRRFTASTGSSSSITRSFSTIAIGDRDQTESSGTKTAPAETETETAPVLQTKETKDATVVNSESPPVQISKLHKTVQSGDMEAAYAMLNAMIDDNKDEAPNSIDYRCFLEGSKRCKGRKIAVMASTVLEHYTKHVDENSLHVKDNLTPHFNCVLNLWLTCTTPPQKVKLKHVKDIQELANLTASILHEMENRKACQPTRTAYNLVLSCYVRTAIAAANASKRGEDHEQTLQIGAQAAEAAEQLLLAMIGSNDESRQPDMESFKSILTAWANVRSLDGTARIMSILDIMEERFGILDARLYSIVFNALAQTASMKDFDPSDQTAPANMSVELLRRLVSHLQEDGPGPLDAMCYASVIKAFANSVATHDFGELSPANLADACLRQCSELHEIGYLKEKPNDYCYGETIAAWSRHADVNLGCEKAEALMKRFEAHVGSKTDAKSRRQRMTFWYNPVLFAFSKSSFPDAPERAVAIFGRMQSMSITNERSYENVLAVWAKNTHTKDDQAKRAETLLAGMNKPPVKCYNMALAACAATRPEFAANGIRVAEKIFAEISILNATSYSHMMSVYTNLLSGHERDRNVRKVFTQCVSEGKVTKNSLDVLNASMSAARIKINFGERYANHVADGREDLSRLPSTW